MLITSHLAATVAASRWLGLPAPELAIALAGGVLLDLDHLCTNRKWASDIKNFLRSGTVTHGEVKQHSWLQEPFFGLAAGTLAGLGTAALWPVRWWIYPLFQATHSVMDSVMRYEHQPFVPFSRIAYRGWIRSNSKAELAISTIAVISALLL